jgi:Tfp pilus assembly protein PilF
MGVIPPQDLPSLLREARAGHTEESAGGATALGQLLLRRKLCSVSDYMYMNRQAREEAAAERSRTQADGAPSLHQLENALDRLESGELEPAEFERLLASSGEPLVREQRAPARFGRYELLAEVARGGMGIVYRARDTSGGKIVALKVMIEADDDEVRLQRFEREAELAAVLDHPNIVKIHDVGREDGMPWFTMDLVEGDSLDNLLEKEAVTRQQMIRALAQVARAVDHAHTRGIVHRDLKPGNILIDKHTGQARITDFGLARDLARVTRLTQVGQAVGTPYYMAPEQVRGERDVDGRCDVYAIGVILYEVLTGDVPFDAESPLSLFKKIDREPVVLEVDPARGIDERIRKIAMRALAKDRDERYSRGELLALDLERYLKGVEPRARARGPLEELRQRWLRDRVSLLALALGALAVCVLASAGALGWRRLGERRARDAGRAQVEQVLDGARTAQDQAAGLTTLDPARAAQLAEEGLGQLEALGALLGAEGASAEGAQEAWGASGGPALEGELQAALARALAELALVRPEYRSRAREALVRASQARPRDVDLRLLLARRLEDDGDPAGALGELDRALEVDPARVEALARRGRLCLLVGRAMDASLSLSDALRLRPRDVDALVLRAEAYLALGRLDAARTDAREAATIDPARVEPQLALGHVARARAASLEASACYAEAARLGPRDPRPHQHRGELLLERGAFEEARDAFERALERGGGAAAGMGQGAAFAALGEVVAARLALEAAATAAEELPEPAGAAARARALLRLAEVALLAGEPAAAREAFTRARDTSPAGSGERLAATVWLVRVGVEGGELERAQALAADLPADSADALEASARVALASRRFMDARDLAERALAASGSARHPRARRTLALARQALALDEPARAACVAAWEDAAWGGDLASEHVRRGVELAALGAPERHESLLEPAARLLEGSLRLDPRQARAWATLAAVRAARGDEAGAWEALTRARELDRFQPDLAETFAAAALASGEATRIGSAAEGLELVLRFEGRALRRLVLLARCRAQLRQLEPALAAAELAVRTAPEAELGHETLALVLGAAGREDDARAATERADACRTRLERLEAEAAAADAAPEAALRAAREALALGATSAALRIGVLEQDRVAALEALSRALLEPGADALVLADAALAEAWRAPLADDRRRVLLLQARDAPPDAHLAVALAALYDGLAGEVEPAWLEQAMPHALEAVRDVPGSHAAHAARAWLRVRTGDAARARRELDALILAAPSAPLVRFLLAEALAADGQSAGGREALARCRGALPRFDERVRASPFLR